MVEPSLRVYKIYNGDRFFGRPPLNKQVGGELGISEIT